MKDQLAAVLDKSLKANGVQLTSKELHPVVKDLMAFLKPEAPVKDSPAKATTVELKPIPPTAKK